MTKTTSSPPALALSAARPLPHLLILSTVTLGAAILFGFASAAAMATNAGAAAIAAIALLIVLSSVFQATQTDAEHQGLRAV